VDDGIINPDGFYNYLTGWFHVDNMMYYVSQAAFFPTPLSWTFELMVRSTTRSEIVNLALLKYP
jgi:hypothetical protein